MKNISKERIINLLNKGVTEKVYPGAVLLVASEGRIVFFEKTGYMILFPEKSSMKKDTVFDLASLTKPLATTLAVMIIVDSGKVTLDQPLADIIKSYNLKDKKDLTVRLLLNHSAGLVDWKPFYLDLVKDKPEDRKKLLRELIIEEPLAYKTGEKSMYSDLGFMLLEWVIESVSGMDLKQFVEQSFFSPMGLNIYLNTGIQSSDFIKNNIAATEDCPWRKRIIRGEVHDENAFALGGYSGHAGLFGNAEEIYCIVNVLRGHYLGKRDDFFKPDTVKQFFQKQNIAKESSWALGWDSPSKENSSSGKYFSSNSAGHLGFTGTSVWMDLEKDIIVIFSYKQNSSET